MPKFLQTLVAACVFSGLGVAFEAGVGTVLAQQQRPAAPARPAAPPPPPPQQQADDDPIEKCGALQGADKVSACMKKVLADSEVELVNILKKAEGKIAAAKIAPADRDAWKNAFAEAQATWKRFVDLDCDGVAV